MSRFHVTVLLALSALALPMSPAFAQFVASPGTISAPDRATPGRATERDDLETCGATAGASRVRPNCEREATTVRAETELTFLIDLPVLLSAQCGATTTTEYRQLNTIARVNGTLEIADCTAASGAFTVELNVRDESGEDKPLEFAETWQRSDDEDVTFAADYPIGENVELVSARVRRLSCTCADPVKEEEPSAED